VVAAAGPGCAVWGVDDRVELGLGEECDECALVAFGSDLQHSLDRHGGLRLTQRNGVLGVAQRAVAVEGADRRQARVAGPGAAPALGLEVIQERADQRRVELVEIEL